MARPKKSRKIVKPPPMVGYKPFGIKDPGSEIVQLTYEEYESLRLVHYQMISQDEAAAWMEVSRPTFTRIYQQALKQIAKAFVEGKTIEIEGGNYQLSEAWFRCRKCFKLIEGLQNHIQCENCLDFNRNELIDLNS